MGYEQLQLKLATHVWLSDNLMVGETSWEAPVVPSSSGTEVLADQNSKDWKEQWQLNFLRYLFISHLSLLFSPLQLAHLQISNFLCRGFWFLVSLLFTHVPRIPHQWKIANRFKSRAVTSAVPKQPIAHKSLHRASSSQSIDYRYPFSNNYPYLDLDSSTIILPLQCLDESLLFNKRISTLTLPPVL
jgi:hypothetical protein